ncbi:Enhancing lycopene biosynthesis protein 2 [Armadillidium vulgare]|nr:Enhancing lycopene biosynthesis protein 2 [Armadillidium vulgare] [Wolbachia endosymbiont of Armadillidium vulgare]
MGEKKLKAAVVLSGCGHLDGAEVREAVLSLLVLDQQEVNVKCFAPDINITQVMNHKTKEATKEKRYRLASQQKNYKNCPSCIIKSKNSSNLYFV